MKSLDSFLSRILPHVVGCPDVTAKEALLDAAIDFCEKTLVIRQTLDPMDTEAGTVEYELFPPSQQSVICPIQVWFKAALLEPVAADRVASVQAYSIEVPDYTEIQGDPRQYFWTTASTIGLYPYPEESETGTLTVRAALKPTRTATQLENALFNDWLDAMVAGTLVRLHAMKDQPWASAERSLLHVRELRAAIQRARMEGSVGRVRTSLNVQMRSF